MSEILNPRFDLKPYYEEDEFLSEQIKDVRKWLVTRSRLTTKIPTNLTDGQIIPFLLASNGCINATEKRIESYYQMRQDKPEFFKSRGHLSRDDLIHLSTFKYIALPKDTPNGDRVFIHCLRESTTVKYKLKEAIKIFLMQLEVDLYLNGPPKRGLIIILDMRRISLSKSRFIFKNSTRTLMNYLYEGLPMKVSSFHVIRTETTFDRFVRLIQKAMDQDVIQDLMSAFILTKIISKLFSCLREMSNKETFHIHSISGSLKEFYDEVAPPDCLPLDFGGELDSLFIMHERSCKKLLAMKQYFIAEEKQRCDISLTFSHLRL